ncbi:hypothetical protein [Absidia glauca]|uniref:Uncharacterized protein n=1 Tax=Absidia glauca TaxID=4829 RepID=A0A163M6V4_ABSGL|nr:hypothetical protein [Absidia glauca]
MVNCLICKKPVLNSHRHAKGGCVLRRGTASEPSNSLEQDQYTQENSMDFDYNFDYGPDFEFENETERLEIGVEPAEDQEAMDFEDNNEQLEDTHPINIEERMDNLVLSSKNSLSDLKLVGVGGGTTDLQHTPPKSGHFDPKLHLRSARTMKL